MGLGLSQFELICWNFIFWEDAELISLLGILLYYTLLYFFKNLSQRSSISEQSNIKLLCKFFTILVLNLSFVADSYYLLLLVYSFGQFVGVTDIKYNGLGECFNFQKIHKSVRIQACKLSDEFFVLYLKTSVRVSMACKMKQRGSFNERVFDVCLCGHHHFYSKVEPKLFLS